MSGTTRSLDTFVLLGIKLTIKNKSIHVCSPTLGMNKLQFKNIELIWFKN